MRLSACITTRNRTHKLNQDLRTDATLGRGARPCAPTNDGSKVNLRKSC